MPLSRLERFLRIFTDVRSGEGVTALLMFVNVFLILCAYYFIKPLREGWIAISDIQGLSKMEVKAYSSFGQSVLLVFIVRSYSHLAGRWTRSDLVTWSTLFCISNMVVFWTLQPGLFIENLPISGIVFYLWVGMFGVFVVAQFWAFAADVYTDEAGRRLIPLVAIGATAGAAFGSAIAELLVNSGLFGTKSLLLAATVPLGVSILITRFVDRRAALRAGRKDGSAPIAASPSSGLQIVLRSRFLLAVGVVTLLLSWVNTNGENLLFRVVQEFLSNQARDAGITGEMAVLNFTRDGTTAFYGNFFFWVNIAALLLQALVASRLLKYGGFSAIFLMLPVIALMSYSVMALVPVLVIVKLMKIAENATDYSINNTARHVLWLPVSSETKFKGKPTIDTLFVRAGDGLAAATILVGVQFYTLATEVFFAFNVALVVIWLATAVVVIREHRRASEHLATDEAA